MKTTISYLGALLAALTVFVSCDFGVAYTVGTLGYRTGHSPTGVKSLTPVPLQDQYDFTLEYFQPEADLIVLLNYEDGKTEKISLDKVDINVYEGSGILTPPNPVDKDQGYTFQSLGRKRIEVIYDDNEPAYYHVLVYDPNASGNGSTDPGSGGGTEGGGMGWTWSHRP